jgi:cytochrome c553
MKLHRFWCAATLAAALPFAAGAQQAATGNPDAAKAINSACTGCHTIPGYKASFPRIYHVPKLGGQSAKYIENALQQYKKGERSHPTMTAIAAGLSDQQIADLAAYYAGRGAK